MRPAQRGNAAMNPIDRSDSHGLHPRGVDQLLDYLPAGVVVHDAASRVVYANRFAYKLLGPTLDAMRTQTALAGTWPFLRTDGSPMPPADYPVTRVLRSGQAVADCVVGVGTVKLDRWLICNAYPVHDAAGELAEVVVCFSDCTELKLAERSLAVSEERLRLALLGSTDASWDWDLPVNHVHYSDRWWDMLGYDAGQERDSGAWRTMMHPNDGERVDAFIAALRDARDTSYSIEFRLRHRDGHYVPILSRGFIQRDAAGKALRISGTNTDLTETKRAESRIYELAYFDYLTGLPNRRLLIEQLGKILTRAARTGQHGALLFIDLDNFKTLNDTLGHDKGDQLLQQVARRLEARVPRRSDTVARHGGDEFVILLEDLSALPEEAASQAELVAEKLIDAFNEPFQLDGHQHHASPSIGVALFDKDIRDIDELLKRADLAMYQAKAAGRHTIRFFDLHMQTVVNARVELEADLRRSLRSHGFTLHYQRQTDSNGQTVGAEALLRWERPSRQDVSPSVFIPLAEETGLILQLGEWVLEAACRQLVAWGSRQETAHLTVAVNVSARQFRQQAFVDQVLQVIARTGADPRRIKLELTESLLLANVDNTIDTMHALKEKGIGFALDDFGTGYSSLAYLKRLPLDQLKIDQSFVRDVLTDPNDAAIARTILGLGHTLGLDVIAEGVETADQRNFLAMHGCRAFQGYLFGRPVTAEQF
ncbi:MAG TPA: PAS domain S-box protein [Massilia sp.]|nr:PAS domain S-box protein [Massilia sp.]